MKNEKIMRDANHAMTGWQLHICLMIQYFFLSVQVCKLREN